MKRKKILLFPTPWSPANITEIIKIGESVQKCRKLLQDVLTNLRSRNCLPAIVPHTTEPMFFSLLNWLHVKFNKILLFPIMVAGENNWNKTEHKTCIKCFPHSMIIKKVAMSPKHYGIHRQTFNEFTSVCMSAAF